MISILRAAAALAFIAGFAVQRGGICAFAATRDIFEERRWGRLNVAKRYVHRGNVSLATIERVLKNASGT
jgi:hypothetical protein